MIQKSSFKVIGIAIRTTNEKGKAAQEIPLLWQMFMNDGISGKIPNKTDDTIYCLYTEYELDHTKPYTTVIGCQVTSFDNIPDNMVGVTIDEDNYQRFVAKGNIQQGSVYKTWLQIWNSDIKRKVTTDFEVYDQKTLNPDLAEVEIFIAVNE